MSVFLRNLCLPENVEAIDNARYSMIIEVEAHTRMTFFFGVYSAEFGCVRLTDVSVASESLAGRKVATTFTPSRAPDTVRCQVKRR